MTVTLKQLETALSNVQDEGMRAREFIDPEVLQAMARTVLNLIQQPVGDNSRSYEYGVSKEVYGRTHWVSDVEEDLQFYPERNGWVHYRRERPSDWERL